MLTYLVNSLFKNNKIKTSLSKAEELHQAMQEYNNLLYDKYLFYYYNSLVINYQVTDKRKAIEVLNEAKTKKAIQQLPIFVVFIYLNLAVFYFDLKNYKNAKKNLALLKRENSFKSLDTPFKLKINVVELMTFFEIGDIDLFDYQLKNILKEFDDLLQKDEYQREKTFIGVLSNLESKKWKESIHQFFDQYPENESNKNDIIDYQIWLKDKLKKGNQ